MAEARSRAEWDHTATMWALTANGLRDPKRQPKPFQPWDIHPLRTADDYLEQQPKHGDLSGLRTLVEGATNGKK